MRKKRAKRRSLQEIKTLIGELEASELSAADLARREGVAVGSVYQWKRKVRSSLEAGDPIEMILAEPIPNDIPASQASGSGLTLCLGKGIECRIDRRFDPDTLLRVMETVNQAGRQRPC